MIAGTGAPSRRADVGILDGRIVSVDTVGSAGAGARASPGSKDVHDQARRELDVDGLTVVPGIIDPHTHYDAQLFWDPCASPSNLHGVTTVLSGNCGFTLAPIKHEDVDYIRRMMAEVEAMPLAALESGVPWNWSIFGEYLDRLDGRLRINTGFLVGHCALRRQVLGAERGAQPASARRR